MPPEERERLFAKEPYVVRPTGEVPWEPPDNTMGFSVEMVEALRRSTAEASCAYLLPLLRPGQHILDVGCGPGTISAGLAQAVHPGDLHGIDLEQSQIDLARIVAHMQNRTNASFQVADATAMPFDDESFDVVHTHNTLTYIADAEAVIAEIKRVLKPGGLIGCREMIVRSCFTQPDYGILRSSWDIFEDVLAADDLHPQMGKELKGHLLEAGFENIAVSSSIDLYHTPEDIAFAAGYSAKWLLSPDIVEAAIKYGAVTPELAEHIQAGFMRWKDDPAAMAGVMHGEAVANKPH